MPDANDAPLRVAAVQATPVFLDCEATVEKACGLIAEASDNGAKLAVFPEAFVPTYPHWIWSVPPGEQKLHGTLYAELLANSVAIPGDATERLCRAARRANISVVIGLNERHADRNRGSLYNTLLYIGADGKILGKDRKLVPTGVEGRIWEQGDGSTLGSYELPFARVGGLICWDNYMPLARHAIYGSGTQIYVAVTMDQGEPWLSTLRHVAKEGSVFVIGVGVPLRLADIPARFEFARFYDPKREWINVGDSAIVGPRGEFIAGPAREKEEILYAEIDLARLPGSKWVLDVAGHYGRPFQLEDRHGVAPTERPRAGLVTILFTDVVGHTQMMQRLGDAKGRDVLRDHERITRELLKHHGGAEVKAMGDGFMASFASVTQAAACAVALQRAFAAHSKSMPEPIYVRVGLNAGEPIEEDGDLFGSTVILASRIAARAIAGEILVPDTVRGLLAGKGFVFGDRGEFVPKGFDESVRVWDVTWRE
jgi:nitrilase